MSICCQTSSPPANPFQCARMMSHQLEALINRHHEARRLAGHAADTAVVAEAIDEECLHIGRHRVEHWILSADVVPGLEVEQ